MKSSERLRSGWRATHIYHKLKYTYLGALSLLIAILHLCLLALDNWLVVFVS
jgi:hypothetical protein